MVFTFKKYQFAKQIFLFIIPMLLTVISAKAQFTEDFKTKYALADSYIGDANYKAALPILMALYPLDTINANINFNIGVCYVNSTFLKSKAIPYLLKAIENVSMDYTGEYNETTAPVHAFYYLGIAYRINYQLTEAIENFEKFKYYLTSDQAARIKDVDRQIEVCYNARKLMANPVSIKIENMGNVVNTAYAEYSPVVAVDGSKLFFTSRREGSTGGLKTEDGKYYEDIYVSESGSGAYNFEKPDKIGPTINTNGHEATISISPDGKQLFIYKDDNGDGNIYVSNLKGMDWSAPEKLGPEINTKYWETHACLSPDGNTLYFVSNRPGGYGGRDIWMSEKLASGKWGKAQNMGPLVNTEYNEESPFISNDGVTLFFSSQGHENMGGFDVFTVTLNQEGQWVDLQNIGYPINTTDDDVFYVPTFDEKHAVYSSAKIGGYGDQDLYFITILEKKKRLAQFKGAVFETATFKPIEAKIEIKDLKTGEIIASLTGDPKTGGFYSTLPTGRKFEVTVSADGYVTQVETIETSEKVEDQMVEKAILMKKPTVAEVKVVIENKTVTINERITLNNIFFDFDKATLTGESTTELNQIYDILIKHPTIKIELASHTDNVGTSEYNKKLSNERSKTVVDYLINKGIDKTRLKYIGYGEDRPIASNKTENGRAKNRRTEFRIISSY